MSAAESPKTKNRRPAEPILPTAEWAREKEITAQFGLSHMILFNLRKQDEIRSLSLRGKGKQYGARLFNVASIRDYLAKQEGAAQ
jgi:hypothetical protein